MSEPKPLIEQLRRSNRRWMALALAACSALVMAALLGLVAMERQRHQAEVALRAAMEAQARAAQAAIRH